MLESHSRRNTFLCMLSYYNAGRYDIRVHTQAAAAGTKEQEATNNLEKKFKTGGPVTLEDTLDVAITALQAVRCS